MEGGCEHYYSTSPLGDRQRLIRGLLEETTVNGFIVFVSTLLFSIAVFCRLVIKVMEK